jgi:hypothetical protein
MMPVSLRAAHISRASHRITHRTIHYDKVQCCTPLQRNIRDASIEIAVTTERWTSSCVQLKKGHAELGLRPYFALKPCHFIVSLMFQVFFSLHAVLIKSDTVHIVPALPCQPECSIGRAPSDDLARRSLFINFYAAIIGMPVG